MKTKHKRKALTFAEFVANVCDVCGSRNAKNIVRLAVNAHWVEFRGQQRFVIY